MEEDIFQVKNEEVVDVLMKKQDKNMCKIKIISTEVFSSRNKYLVEIRASKPIGKLEYDFFQCSNNNSWVGIHHYRKIKRLKGALGKVIEDFDREEGKKFYHYRFYLLSSHNWDVEDISESLQKHLEQDEHCKIELAWGESIKFLPCERPRVKIINIPEQVLLDRIQGLVDSWANKSTPQMEK